MRTGASLLDTAPSNGRRLPRRPLLLLLRFLGNDHAPYVAFRNPRRLRRWRFRLDCFSSPRTIFSLSLFNFFCAFALELGPPEFSKMLLFWPPGRRYGLSISRIDTREMRDVSFNILKFRPDKSEIPFSMAPLSAFLSCASRPARRGDQKIPRLASAYRPSHLWAIRFPDECLLYGRYRASYEKGRPYPSSRKCAR